MRGSHVYLVCALGAGVAHAQISFTEVGAPAGLHGAFAPAAGYPGNHDQLVGGATIGDFNADGRPDIFAPSGGTAPDRLFINMGDGTFQDQAGDWGIDATHRAGGCAVADFDANGFQDIFVVSYGAPPGASHPLRSMLYRNNGPDDSGAFSFTEIGVSAGVNRVSTVTDGMGASFGDYDLDGDLDLFVSAWFDVAGGNRLFRNNNDATFTDVTTSLGVVTDNLRGFTPRFTDMNADRWPDLLLTNDYSTSRYFVNNGPGQDGVVTFRDETARAGIGIDCNGMGSAVGDIDNDADFDWFMTNIYFPPPSDNCGNTLYVSDGPDAHGQVRFTEQARARGVHNVGWGWGTVLCDLDNDADLDLAATGGWRSFANTPARVFLNDGAGSFTDATPASGFDFVGQGRSLLSLDYDLDGDLDLLMAENGAPLRLYRNNLSRVGRGSLRVRLRTDAHPCLAPDGFGAVIEVHAGESTQRRIIDGAISYLGQSEGGAHFGVGAATEITRVRVLWPDGSETVLGPLAPNQVIEVVRRHPADFDESATLDTFDLVAFLAAFDAGDPDADLDADGDLTIADPIMLIDALAAPCATR